MVDPKKIDLSMATIAIITVPPQQSGINQQELEKILTPPFTIGQSLEGVLVSSQKDQIQVITGGIKTNVQDLSGRKGFSRNKIPSVLHFFVDRLKLKVTTYGVNFIINVPCMEPVKWIGDNIISSQVSKKTKKTLIGGTATVQIAAGQKTWNIKFESRGDKGINVDFNATENAQQLPNQKRLCEELQEQFQALLELLNALEL
ncbi:hypothetical protein ACFLUU_10285 [Chloroflexota bacterium]